VKRAASQFALLILLAAVIIAGLLVLGFFYHLVQNTSTSKVHSTVLQTTIIHTPTFLGGYPFILGSGNVMENGTAYSYVRINASAIMKGDSFLAYPDLNVGIAGGGVNDNNLSVQITYFGSDYGTTPYWINFSSSIQSLNLVANSSQMGIEGTFARSEFPISGLNGVEYFVQVSNVVGESNEFEYFFYIGNASTPVPVLSHGPPH
jgi:hypothetical protein